MYPYIVVFGHQFGLKGLIELAGMLIAFVLVHRQWRKEGRVLTDTVQFVSWICIGAVAGGHVAYALIFDHNIIRTWSSFANFSAGFSSAGSIVVGLFSAWIFCRIKKYDFLSTLDGVVITVLIIHVAAKIGCFFEGCCWGIPTKLPIGITYTHALTGAPLNIPLHPVQLYEAFATIAIIAFISFKKMNFAGEKILWYGCLYGLIRFACEFFRGDPAPYVYHLRIDQIWSAGLFAICGMMITIKYKRNMALNVLAAQTE